MLVKAYEVYKYIGSRWRELKRPVHVATISYDTERKEYRADQLKEHTVSEIFKIDWFKPSGENKVVYGLLVLAFLEDRVLPPSRQNLKPELEEHGIYRYDWRDLIILNRGRVVDDPYEVLVVPGYNWRDYMPETDQTVETVYGTY